jgi:hypothetical protein
VKTDKNFSSASCFLSSFKYIFKKEANTPWRNYSLTVVSFACPFSMLCRTEQARGELGGVKTSKSPPESGFKNITPTYIHP